MKETNFEGSRGLLDKILPVRRQIDCIDKQTHDILCCCGVMGAKKRSKKEETYGVDYASSRQLQSQIAFPALDSLDSQLMKEIFFEQWGGGYVSISISFEYIFLEKQSSLYQYNAQNFSPFQLWSDCFSSTQLF